jgi:hypothetical protein
MKSLPKLMATIPILVAFAVPCFVQTDGAARRGDAVKTTQSSQRHDREKVVRKHRPGMEAGTSVGSRFGMTDYSANPLKTSQR